MGSSLLNGFTVSAWINPRTNGEGNANGRILDVRTGSYTSANGFWFKLGSAGTNVLMFNINNGSAKSSGSNINFNVWQHVLVTISSAQLVNFYINKNLSGSANQDVIQTISTITGTSSTFIGNRGAKDVTFDGTIRKVKMWNRVLTTDEIAKDFAGALIEEGLILDVPLKDDYNDKGQYSLTGLNNGSYLSISDDSVATAIKTQRATTGATGKFLLTKGKGGQVYHAAITES